MRFPLPRNPVEEVLRLGIDSTDAKSGAADFAQATGAVQKSASAAAAATDKLEEQLERTARAAEESANSNRRSAVSLEEIRRRADANGTALNRVASNTSALVRANQALYGQGLRSVEVLEQMQRSGAETAASFMRMESQLAEAVSLLKGLATATEGAKDRLDKLARGSRGATDALKDTRRETVEAGTAFERLAARTAAAADRMDEARHRMRGMSGFASGAQTVGLGLTAVGGAVTAGNAVAIREAMSYEVALANLAKTSDLADDALGKLGDEFTRLSELPGRPSAESLIGIAAEGAQLGIATENLRKFTETIANVDIATNLGSSAASELAQFGNIMGTLQGEIDRTASALVALGNNSATTERSIMEMGGRLAGAGALIGLTEGQVLGFSTALASLKIEAEAGGTAFSRVFGALYSGVSKGGIELQKFAIVAGMTQQEFSKLFKDNPAEGIAVFLDGLARMREEGKNVFGVLESLGMEDMRLRDALLRTSGAIDLVRDSLALGDQAWRENTALLAEASRFQKTTASDLQGVLNTVRNVAREYGQALIPALRDLLATSRSVLAIIRPLVSGFASLPEPVRAAALGIGALVTVAGMATLALGSLTRAIIALQVAKAAAGVGGIAGLAASLAGPAGLAAGAGTATVALSGLGATLLPGGALLVGVAALAVAFHRLGVKAEEGAQKAVDSIERIKQSLPTMPAEDRSPKASAAFENERQAYAEFERLRKSATRLFNQGSARDGAPGRALYEDLRAQAEHARGVYRRAKDLADAFRSQAIQDLANSGTPIELPGLTVVGTRGGNGSDNPLEGLDDKSKSAASSVARLVEQILRLRDAQTLGFARESLIPPQIADAVTDVLEAKAAIRDLQNELAGLAKEKVAAPAGVSALRESLDAELSAAQAKLDLFTVAYRAFGKNFEKRLEVKVDLQSATSDNNSLVRGGASLMGVDAPRSFMRRPEVTGLQKAASDYRNAEQSLRLALGAKDREGAERARAELKRLGRTIEEARRTLAVALSNSGLNSVQIAGVLSVTDEAQEKAGLKAEKTNKTLKAMGDHASTMAGLARGVLSVADAMGTLDDDTRKALQGTVDLAEGIGRIAKGDVVGGVAQGIGGLVNAISGLFGGGESPAQKAQREALEANTRQLEMTRAELAGFRGTQTDRQRVLNATRGALADPTVIDFLKVSGPRNDDWRMTEFLRPFGLTLGEFEKIAKDAGVTLRDSAGNILPKALEQFAEYLELSIGSLQGFRNTLDSQRQRDDIRSKLYGIEDTPQNRLGNELGYLEKFAGGLSQQFGLNGLDLSSASGREAARKGLQELFERFDSGQLPGLEGFTRDEFLAWLSSSANALAELDKATSAATSAMSNVPKAVNLDLYRAIYGTRPVEAGGVTPSGPTPGYPTTPGTGTIPVPPPPPGLTTPNPPRSNGGDTFSFGDVHISGPIRDYDDLVRKLEAKVREKRRAGDKSGFLVAE